MAEYDTILVPTDGSEHAEQAVEVALGLAEGGATVVHALFVVDTHLYGEPALSSIELFVDQMDEQGSQLLSEVVGRANERGVDIVREVEHGRPHDVIVAYADEIDADLIVMGYQGERHRRGMGTVVERVLADTDRHVLVV
jgi:nucleotide-binding universal stress UspA family protein